MSHPHHARYLYEAESHFDQFLLSGAIAIFPLEKSLAGYGYRTSGLFFDCICRGVVCVVQEGTWAASVMTELGLPAELCVDFEAVGPDFLAQILSKLGFYQSRLLDAVRRLDQYYGPVVASRALVKLHES